MRIWEELTNFFSVTRRPINILVGIHCDASAALLTMMSLLKSSLIGFTVHPVYQYDELLEIVEETQRLDASPLSLDSEQFFMLLGIGGAVDLQNYFDFAKHCVVLLDSYRPYSLTLLQSYHQLPKLFVWGYDRIASDVTLFFQRALQREKRKRRNVSQYGASSESDSTDDDDDGNKESDETAAANEPVNWEQPGHLSEELTKAYRASCGGGFSCALEVYELSVLLHRSCDKFVWHSAVGVFDLVRRNSMDYGSYLVAMRPLHDSVALHLTANRRDGGLNEVDVNTSHLRAASNSMRLKNVDESQFLLLRHSCLWDSLWNDPFISSVLGFHHPENGESTLKLLLAKCGVSLEASRRPFHELLPSEQEVTLRLILQELDSVFHTHSKLATPRPIQTISRCVGFSREVSALDVCVLFEAMLAVEAPTSNRSSGISERTTSTSLGEHHRKQFWMAQELIDMDPSDKRFFSAVMHAVELYKLVGDATSALMQPSMVLSTQGLHYIQLNDPSKTASALETFSTPARLRLLSGRLLKTLTVERGVARSTGLIRPLLLAAASSQRDVKQINPADNGTEKEVSYVVTLSQENGVSDKGLHYSRPNYVFNECLSSTSSLGFVPSRSFADQQSISMEGNENAIHFAEMMHLQSVR